MLFHHYHILSVKSHNCEHLEVFQQSTFILIVTNSLYQQQDQRTLVGKVDKLIYLICVLLLHEPFVLKTIQNFKISIGLNVL